MTVAPHTELAATVERFLDLACLDYQGNDGVARRDQATQLLVDVPGLAAASIHVAAAIGDLTVARALLAADPGQATASGGPRNWPPLLYLAYSRVNPPGADLLGTAQALLAHGADPNSHTTITECRFSALTGIIGEGEGGPVAQPPHPQASALVPLLLDAGADPNDSQALYNTHFSREDHWLRLFLARGLTATSRINWDTKSTGSIVDFVLGQAIHQGYTDRVRLLLEHGASPHGRNHYNQRTHLHNALLQGHTEIAALLQQAGATPPVFTPGEQFRVACLRGDASEARRLLAADPTLNADPGPLIAAAEHGNLAAVHLALALGLPIAGRDHGGLTALHTAARQGHRAVAEALVAAGAPLDVRDPVYGGTPVDHARHSARTWPSSGLVETLAYLLNHTSPP